MINCMKKGREFGLGAPAAGQCADGRWIRWRIEPFGQHAGTDACVLEIAGAPGCRGTYVKWFLARAEGAEPVVVFVSFHSTDRSNR